MYKSSMFAMLVALALIFVGANVKAETRSQPEPTPPAEAAKPEVVKPVESTEEVKHDEAVKVETQPAPQIATPAATVKPAPKPAVQEEVAPAFEGK